MNITFTIPDAQLPRVIAAMKWRSQIPEDENGMPLFTDGQWAKESMRRYIISRVKRYESYLAQQAAEVPEDNSIVT